MATPSEIALFKLLNEHDEFNIVGHIRPDGDCIGAQIAMHNIIKSMGKKCTIINNYDIPPSFLPLIANVKRVSLDEINNKLPLICLDCSDLKRLGDNVVEKFPRPFLNIDHHTSNDFFAEHNIVDEKAASTTEILANILMTNDFKIDKQTAGMLYIGILIDTGRFAYEKTTEKTFEIAQYLVKNGANPAELYRALFSRERAQRFKLLERFLRNMEIDFEKKICISTLSENDFKETGAEWYDSEDFVNYTRSIEGVDIGIYIEEKNGKSKISMRSDDQKYRLDLFAKNFAGGGHPCASGFTIDHNTEDAKDFLKKSLVKHAELTKNN